MQIVIPGYTEAVACNFIKKRGQVRVFSCEFCEIFKSTFFIGHVRWLLLATPLEYIKILLDLTLYHNFFGSEVIRLIELKGLVNFINNECETQIQGTFLKESLCCYKWQQNFFRFFTIRESFHQIARFCFYLTTGLTRLN